MAVDLRTIHFRFGKEELLEATHDWHGLEDANISLEAGITFLLRFNEDNLGDTIANVDSQFQYNCNGAGWVDITTTSAIVKAVASVAFTNGQDCTARLTAGGGTFEASGAGCTEDGLSGGNTNDIGTGYSETECALQIVASAVSNGDSIVFRLTSPDTAITNSVTPTVTVIKNLVLDGALEHWTSATNLQAWTEEIGGTNTVNREAVNQHSGTYCLRFDLVTAWDEADVYQTVTMVAGAAYTLDFWYYTSSADHPTCLQFYDTASNQYLKEDGTWNAGAYDISLAAQAAWYHYSLAFNAHASYTSYYIVFNGSQLGAHNSSVYFDDATLDLTPSGYSKKVIIF